MKKKRKHATEMTTDEAISHLFHPDALEHLKKHIDKIENEKKKSINKEP